jgi:hypothetical protein
MNSIAQNIGSTENIGTHIQFFYQAIVNLDFVFFLVLIEKDYQLVHLLKVLGGITTKTKVVSPINNQLLPRHCTTKEAERFW